MQSSPHAIDGDQHTGILNDNQIPLTIMRNDEHETDPHTMTIDGRDVSVDGAKLDTIESGAQVNNLTNQQAASLVSGAHSNWHTHDSWYYRKTSLSTSGESSVHWGNITNTPLEWNPTPHNHNDLYYTETELNEGQLDARYYTENEIDSNFYTKVELNNGSLDGRYYTETEVNSILTNYYTKVELNNGSLDGRYYTETEMDGFLADKANKIHNHNTLYYTKTELDAGQLDGRYFTETEITTNYYDKVEVDGLIAAASYGISGSVEFFSSLPIVSDVGIVYIVQQKEGEYEEGFYRWDGSSWVWLAHNIGGVHHNDLLGLNSGDYQHLTSSQLNNLTTGLDASNLHIHDTRYYTESEIDGFLLTKSNTGHTHDDRYYTETELNNIISNYYTKGELDAGQLDDRYYTETETNSKFYNKLELDAGQLDTRYYTEAEVDGLLSSKSDTGHTHDDRYYTETELDARFDLFFTKNNLLNGSLDVRYYTKGELSGGSLDTRYYTESEVDSLISAASYGISGSVEFYENLPIDQSIGTVYIVKQSNINGDEGFYRWDGTTWEYLAPNTGAGETIHNNLSGLNDGDYKHLTSLEYSKLTQGSNSSDLHIHDDRYYTETELNGLLFNKADVGHNHDDRYYTEGEVDLIVSNYYTEAELNSGQLDNRYYTETELDPLATNGGNVLDARYFTESEITTNHYTKIELDNGQLNNLYYTKNEIDQLTSLYYSRSSLDNGILDFRYYTETEIDALLSGYYSKSQLDAGQLDNRYFTKTEITSNYYTKSNLDSGQLDGRYYTESEVDSLIASIEAFGIRGSVQYYEDLPVASDGEVWIVRETNLNGDEGFYRWDGVAWSYLAPNTGNVDHNSLQGLNTGDYQHLTSIQLSELTSGSPTTIHNHNNIYYTETEVDGFLSNKADINHTHDDRYYTEAELDGLLSSKSDTSHTHDDRYYTETELDGFLSNKADLNHTHDDRYYTETEITTNYYSKAQLNAGQLNTLYYTETELDGFLSNKANTNHIHDDRYYTEIELDGFLSNKSDIGHTHDDRYYTEAEVDGLLSNKADINHNHDDRYYTETELHGVGGANRIGISTISGLTSSTVQEALEEIYTNSPSGSNLQGAYDLGNTITVGDTNGPVMINGGTTPPLQLTSQSSTPTQNTTGGSITVIDNILYIYDGVRMKWLTPSKLITFGRSIADGHKLDQAGIGEFNSGYRMAKDGTILSVTLYNSEMISSKELQIFVNDTMRQSISIINGSLVNNSIDINFTQNDLLSVYISSEDSPMKNVIVTMEVAWRK